MPAAEPRNTARTIAAAHQALAGPHWRVPTVLRHDGTARGLGIVRAVAARIKVHLGLRGAEAAAYQCKGKK
jgi:hypothetical protein